MAYLIEPVNIPPNNIQFALPVVSNIVGAINCFPYLNGYYISYDNPFVGGGKTYNFIFTFQAGLLNNLAFNQFSFDLDFTASLPNLALDGQIQQFISVFALTYSSFVDSCEIGQFLVTTTGPGLLSYNLMVRNTTANFRFMSQFSFSLP